MKQISILVVDDERFIRETLTRFLQEEGFSVDSAEDGASAWEKIQIARFDLILTDIKMPNMDGFELLKKIRGVAPDIAVIMMTGFSQEYTVREAMKLGASGYLSKPFKTAEVLSAVDRACKKIRSTSQDSIRPETV
jgi:YesN/AraC family two-component response regulator